MTAAVHPADEAERRAALPPHEGEPATEKSEIWVMFDDKNLYVSGRMWDSHPERMLANEMRRDAALDIYNAAL